MHVHCLARARYLPVVVCGGIALLVIGAIPQAEGWLPRIQLRQHFVPEPGYALGMALAALCFCLLGWFFVRAAKQP